MDRARYPPRNFFSASPEAVGFRDLAGGDYRLAPSSPYRRGATHDRDIGVDLAALELALGEIGPTSGKKSSVGGTIPVRRREP
jgi:hypothetical protein